MSETSENDKTAVRCTGLLAELEAELERAEHFLRQMHAWKARPRILESAQRQRDEIRERVRAERGHSATSKHSDTAR